METVYARRIYPPIKDALSRVTSLIPFSIAEILLYVLLASVIVTLLIKLVSALFDGRRWRNVLSFLLSLGILAGVLLNWFYLSWGANYFRAPLAQRMELTLSDHSHGELEGLSRRLAERAATLRETLPERSDGVFRLQKGKLSAMEGLEDAYAAVSGEIPALSGQVTRAKCVLFSEGLSDCGIAGIYVGMTAEPNVNVNQPDLLFPQAAAHEMAHQLGIASEDEAEFVACLVCMASEDPCVVYSGLMQALIRCMNELYAEDRDAYDRIKKSVYTEGMKKDLSDYSAYWKAHEGKADQVQTQLNDAYLKHNDQQSGVKSYGESVELLLAYYRTEKKIYEPNN